MDGLVFKTVSPQHVGVGETDLSGGERQLARVVAQSSQARIQVGIAVVVLRVCCELVWCALGTEVVGMRAASVVALVRRGDDRCE